MFEFSSKFVRRGGYSFDELTITEMVQRSSAFAEIDVEIEVTLAGGQSITTTKAQDILEDTYVKGSLIEKLVIRAWNTKNASKLRHVMIILDGNAADGISVDLKADRQSTTLARTEIQNLIDGRRQWYSRLFPRGAWLLLLMVIWFMSSAVFGGTLVGLLMPGQVAIALWVALVGGLLALLAGVYLMNAMFPRVSFEFGCSQKRVASAKLWRKTIGVVIVLGFIVAVGGAVFGEIILRHFQ